MFRLAFLSLLFFAACDASISCKKDYDMLGCYEEYSPGTLLFNDRKNINWGNIEGYMRSLACKCAEKAKADGYAGFAMHFWGECYGRTSAELEALVEKSHKRHKCVGNQKYTHCDVDEHEHCTGADYAEAVYKFKASSEENVNGGLGEWEGWTPCDKSCGSGLQVRERNCDSPVPRGSGKDCSELGPLSETRVCKIKECPVNGGWSSWTWGACSKTCGGGVKYASRTCTNPSPQNGGSSCAGASRQSASCNTHGCPVNGGWSSWSWGACSKTCGGGVKYASRTCTNPSPQNGGSNCAGASRQSASCNTHGCPVNGGWSSFGSYGSCSKTCGGGVKYARRTCTNPSPKNGGSSCAGSSTTSTSCNTHGCPVNGGWSSFGSYGSCSRLCGGGSQTRYRSCSNPSPKNGGASCPGSSSQSTSCNTNACPAINSCSYKYTSYQTHSDGNMVYIDRHRMNCGGSGNILSMFHLQRSGGNMRYQYKCCKIQGSCSLQSKQTSFSDDGGGNLVHLDRHGADCGNSGFINDIRVERNSAHNKVRYNYYCCNLSSTWASRSTCYTSYTGFTDDGGGKVFYLDRQTVSCNSGYALSYIRLNRNSSHNKVRYHYRCCKVNY